MATKPILHDPATPIPQPALTASEGWDLLLSMYGIAHETYAKLGGAEEAHRKERAAWDDSVSS